MPHTRVLAVTAASRVRNKRPLLIAAEVHFQSQQLMLLLRAQRPVGTCSCRLAVDLQAMRLLHSTAGGYRPGGKDRSGLVVNQATQSGKPHKMTRIFLAIRRIMEAVLTDNNQCCSHIVKCSLGFPPCEI